MNMQMAPKEQDGLNEELQKSLALFEFTNPLPDKRQGTFRLYYNNCNGWEINKLISNVLNRTRDKRTHKYLKDIENPTKLDRILTQLKIWVVDVLNLAEMCVAWKKIATRRAIRQVTTRYDQNACWVGSSNEIRGEN